MQSTLTQRDRIFRQFQIHKFKRESMFPTVTLTINMNVTHLAELKRKWNETHSTAHLTFTHIVIKAVADTLMNYPVLYSLSEGTNIIPSKDLILNIPVDVEKHVEYIVIHQPESKTILDISQECQSEIEKIRNGNGEFMNFLMEMFQVPAKAANHSPADFMQHYGNFVISNMGSFHIDSGSLAITAPLIAGLCLGAITPIVKCQANSFIEVMNLPMTISFDHRAIDGAYAGKFLNDVKKLLENPEQIFQLT